MVFCTEVPRNKDLLHGKAGFSLAIIGVAMLNRRVLKNGLIKGLTAD